MAVVNTKATAIINRDASPPVLSPAHLVRGPVYSAVGTVEVAAADDDTSVYRFVRVHSSDRVETILIACDAITGGTSYDVGLYQTALNGGAVVSAALWGSAIDLSSALPFTDVTYEATATNKDKVEKRVWELAGLTEDPLRSYDICLTANTVGSGAGTISMRVHYCPGN